MLEFNKKHFADLLCAAPEKVQLLESEAPNPYVKSLIDTFAETGRIDPKTLDLNAFELKHVTPEGYDGVYTGIHNGWIKGFIRFCRKTPSVCLKQRSFF